MRAYRRDFELSLVIDPYDFEHCVYSRLQTRTTLCRRRRTRRVIRAGNLTGKQRMQVTESRLAISAS